MFRFPSDLQMTWERPDQLWPSSVTVPVQCSSVHLSADFSSIFVQLVFSLCSACVQFLLSLFHVSSVNANAISRAETQRELYFGVVSGGQVSCIVKKDSLVFVQALVLIFFKCDQNLKIFQNSDPTMICYFQFLKL